MTGWRAFPGIRRLHLVVRDTADGSFVVACGIWPHSEAWHGSVEAPHELDGRRCRSCERKAQVQEVRS